MSTGTTRHTGTGRQKYSSNTDLHFYLCNCYKPGYRFFCKEGEESPDSAEQCTGEEPAPEKEETVPQKITTGSNVRKR